MKIRRGIFGGAMLFAAAGCAETTTVEPIDAANEVTTTDTKVADTATVTDAGAADTAVQADTNGVDAASDVMVEDTSVADVAGVDANLEDTSVVDASVADTEAHDASEGDVFVDAALPPEDVAGDTSGCKLLTVDNALGEKCDEPMTAICDPEAPQSIALLCHQSEWTKFADLEMQFPFGCFCDSAVEECSYAFAICAAPGFLGLDRAGRVRKAPRRLRLV